MSWGTLIRRRFEVVTAAILLSLTFLLIVWALMVLLKTYNPYVFHFNLLMDMLPWVTPVVILLAMAIPLYVKVTGYLMPPDGGVERLAAHRFDLIAGSAAYLLCYSMVVWGLMLLLRVWDVYDFHFNMQVDWLPAIVPLWLIWIVMSPLLWKTLGALGGLYDARPRAMGNWTAVVVPGFLGGAFLTGGGLMLNEGVYAGTAGLSKMVQVNLVAFGTLVFSVGGICWAVMLLNVWRGWRRDPAPATRLTPLDRFRLERGRIVAHGFVLVNLTFAVCALLMTAVQYVDALDFHFYMAKDIWGFGLPLFFGWVIFALAAHLLPARLATRDPARWGTGSGLPEGPTGTAPQAGWGYRDRDLAGTGG